MKKSTRLLRAALSLLLAAAFLCACSPQTAAPAAGTPTASPVLQEAQPRSATATSQGFGGSVTVTVTALDGRITAVTAEGPDETAGIGSRAIEELPARMVEAGSVEVDSVSGATFSSEAVLSAARSAYGELTGQKTAAVRMAPGTYNGSAAGFRTAWTIDAAVTVSETEILSIEIAGDSADTVGVFPSAVNLLVPRIIEHQSVAVDAITGATASSNGIKGAVTEALKAALKAGGSDESAIDAFRTVPEKSTDVQTIETGVLVVGMGGAGTMAALRAAEAMYAQDPASVNVLAIDKAGRYGGTSSLTADFFAINPEQYKKEHNGGADYVDKAALRADWLSYTQGDAKEALVDLLLDNSGSTLDWMVYEHGLQLAPPSGGLAEGDDMVVKFQYAPNDQGLTVRRTANLAFYDGCIESYTGLGGKYLLETEGYELLCDSATGAVQGVKARGSDGTEYEIHARAVILATGGFAGNAAMEEQYLSNDYFPLKGSWSQVGMTQCTGEMIQSAIDIGANTFNIGMSPMVHMAGSAGFLTQFEYHITDAIQSSTNRNMVWTEGDLPMYLGIAGNSLAVDSDGKRFASETGVAMLDPWKAGPTYYSIYSSEQIGEVVRNGLKYPCTGPASINLGACGAIPNNTPLPNAVQVLDAAVEAGFAAKADTLSELASLLGMGSLEETVAAYNGYCETGVDEEFGKPAEYLDPIGSGPYYAITMRSYCYSTCGALDVDEELRVLRTDGQPIGGLYAAGLDSMGVLFTDKNCYVTYGGVAQGWAYTSGRLAGERAASSLQ